MTTYHYNRQRRPPAPFVYVDLHNPATGQTIALLPAQVDSAADATVFPSNLAATLGLIPVRTATFAGAGNALSLVETFLIDLTVRNLEPTKQLRIEAAGWPNEPYFLLGRDVLNQYRIVLDGPQLKMEIE